MENKQELVCFQGTPKATPSVPLKEQPPMVSTCLNPGLARPQTENAGVVRNAKVSVGRLAKSRDPENPCHLSSSEMRALGSQQLPVFFPCDVGIVQKAVLGVLVLAIWVWLGLFVHSPCDEWDPDLESQATIAAHVSSGPQRMLTGMYTGFPIFLSRRCV